MARAKGGLLLVNIDGSKLTFDENNICKILREDAPKELLSLYDFVMDTSLDKKQLSINFYHEDTSCYGGIMTRVHLNTYQLLSGDGVLLTISKDDSYLEITYSVY